MKRALITGVTGQDGSYLAELLLAKNYDVHGIVRRASTFNRERIEHLFTDIHTAPGVSRRLFTHYGDLADANSIRRLIYEIEPDEIYNLGAQSHVRVSFDIPEYTANITGLGALRVLEAIKDYERVTKKRVRLYQASSSEMFGSAPPPQNESTKFCPRSPYGYSKVFAYYAAVNYREAYGLYAVNGILFNHESPRRGENFLTRKVTIGVAKIKAGLTDMLQLGNLEARRDWGYAPEYMEAAWRMLQQPEPEDYVIGTGESHSVEEFISAAFVHAGIADWRRHVALDPRYLRPSEVDHLVADAHKAKEKLGWSPATKFDGLVKIMVDADIEALQKSESN